MNETIKLRVPAEPQAEFVSMGNFHAELVPDSTIEVTHRRWAVWLVEHYGLVEITGSGESSAKGRAKKGGTE